jgi:hypothetical protein
MTDPSQDYGTVDFLTDTAVVDDPYPYYRYLRETHGPVWIEPIRRVAMVTGLAEAMVGDATDGADRQYTHAGGIEWRSPSSGQRQRVQNGG